MTRERRLAIQMWEQIKEALPEWYVVSPFAVGERVLTYKYKFCSDNNIDWLNYCWLCQYAMTSRRSCARCPLKSCGYMPNGEASPWQVVMAYRYSLELKLDACDTIIAVLKGTNKREEIQA